MPIEAACACGARFSAESHLAGKTVQCPTCGQPFRVPSPEVSLIAVRCTCGKSYRVKSTLAGQRVQCAACKQTFVAHPVELAAPSSPGPAFDNPAAMKPAVGPASLDPFGGSHGLGNMDLGNMGFGGTGLPGTHDPLAAPAGFAAPMQATVPAQAPMPFQQPYAATDGRRSRRGISGKTLLMAGGAGVVVIVLAAVVVAGVWFLPGLISPGYSSPEAVFAAQQSARKSKNWKKVFGTMTPESQDTLVSSFLLFAIVGGGREPEIDEVFKKHGINAEEVKAASGISSSSPLGLFSLTPEKLKGASSSIKNKPAFFADIMSVVVRKAEERRQKSGQNENPLEEPTEARIADVVITGDTAVGKQTMTINGRSVEGQARFRRVDGRWYAEIQGAMGGALGGGPFSTPSRPSLPQMTPPRS